MHILLVPIICYVLYALVLSDYPWSFRLYLLGAVFVILVVIVVYKNLQQMR